MKLKKEIPKGISKPEDRGRLAEGLNIEHHGHPKAKSLTAGKAGQKSDSQNVSVPNPRNKGRK